MEEVAICSDIHGNLPALEKFLEETDDVDKRVFLGDVVGYCGPFPNECVRLVRDEFDYILSGNHDRMVSTQSVDEKYQKRPRLNEGIVKSIELTDSSSCEFLKTIPEEIIIELNGQEILLTHSNPFEEDGYVYSEEFEDVYDRMDVDHIFIGHTHEQAVQHFDDGFMLNPGSVGLPKKGFDDGRYAIWDGQELTLHSFEYDREVFVEACRDVGLSSEFFESFL